MKCQSTTTRLNNKKKPLWYKVKQAGQIIGYHCTKCYDKIRKPSHLPWNLRTRNPVINRICINCKSSITRIDPRGCYVWYRVIQNDNCIGYHCAICHDRIRRLPFFQNFKKKLKQRLCSNCSNKTIQTITKKGYPHERWYKDNKNGFWCNSCYHKITDDPKIVKKRNSTRIKFKDKIIYLDKNPRKGICSLCHRKGKTDIHHIKYHVKNPLKDTIEICSSCHMKETMKIHNVKSLRWNLIKVTT